MKRTTNPLALLRAASLVALVAACAGKDDAANDSTAAADSANTAAAGAQPSSSTTPAAGATAPGALLDPNTATRDQLVGAGLDAAIADSIVAGRPYENMLAVDRKLVAARLSEQKRDSIYERMFKPLDLNTASKEEIMLIPGVGEKMHHEFEEYRPYQNIDRFRREIAKYVDDSTVTRYEKYVMIR